MDATEFQEFLADVALEQNATESLRLELALVEFLDQGWTVALDDKPNEPETGVSKVSLKLLVLVP